MLQPLRDQHIRSDRRPDARLTPERDTLGIGTVLAHTGRRRGDGRHGRFPGQGRGLEISHQPPHNPPKLAVIVLGSSPIFPSVKLYG